jgi:hypothetical protein
MVSLRQAHLSALAEIKGFEMKLVWITVDAFLTTRSALQLCMVIEGLNALPAVACSGAGRRRRKEARG